MKKILKLLAVALCLVIGVTAFVACGGEGDKNIMVISREAGSGTRDGFNEFVKKPGDSNVSLRYSDISGKTEHASSIFVDGMISLNSTSAVITQVENNKNAIAYVSYGSVKENTNVNILDVNGKTPFSSSDYEMRRPFYIVYAKAGLAAGLASDFGAFLRSKDAQTGANSVAAEWIQVDCWESLPAYSSTLTAAQNDVITVTGSTSVEPLMDMLIDAYIAKNAGKVTMSNFAKQNVTGSSAGRTAAQNDTTGKIIGMSSSSEANALNAGTYAGFKLCTDDIVVIVHRENGIGNITYAQLWDIYTGAAKRFF